ncbi:MAG: polyprenyl synthetase family protein [Rikenellaceae bacterium]|nr:polyprenyl synthetase family protein [Rikenellaceae bacterium]
MQSFEKLSNRINQAVAESGLPAGPATLFEPIRYTMAAGGKRVRPVLALAACNLFCGDAERAVDAALGIEVFHNFTLLHDDIMDDAPLRRGRPTVHERWSPNAAILSGDAMVILAYELMSQVDPSVLPAVLAVFNRVAMEVCKGQRYDMDFEQRTDVSKSEYLRMIELKCAVLLGGAARIGAIIGGAAEAEAQKLYDFGVALGLAFQLQDDLLDTYGNPETFGKAIGGDILAGKKTFLFIHALERAEGEIRKRLLRLLRSPGSDPQQKIAETRALYTETGAERAVRDLVFVYFRQAEMILDNLTVDAARKTTLREISDTLKNRER